jgi:hypothetical protein
VYLATDLAACSAGLQGDPLTWLPQKQVLTTYGFSVMTLWLWRKKGCPYLKGKKLRAWEDRTVITRRGAVNRQHRAAQRVCRYYRPDLDDILNQIQDVQRQGSDPEWLDYREAKEFGFSQSALSTWATKYCPALGRKLKTKTCHRWRRNRIMEVTLYSRADLARVRPQAFLSGQDVPTPSQGGGYAQNAPQAIPDVQHEGGEAMRSAEHNTGPTGLSVNAPGYPVEVMNYSELVALLKSEGMIPTGAPGGGAGPGCPLTFRPGEVVYKGYVIPLSGRPWQVLKEIASVPGRGRSAKDILRALWPDGEIEPGTVNSHVSAARQALQKALHEMGIESPADPLPVVDRGELLAWRLDLP